MHTKAQIQKKVIIGLTATAMSVFLLCAAVVLSEAHKYSALGLKERTLVKAEFAGYAGYPFSSEMLFSEETESKETLTEIEQYLSEGRLCYSRAKNVTYALKLYFENGETVIALVAEDRLGFLYGSVWIKAEGITELLLFEESE